MKRTTLMVDAQLLKDASRALGTVTYSETVNRSLQESVRLAQARGILDFVGRGVWTGDLPEMRGDRPTRRPRRK